MVPRGGCSGNKTCVLLSLDKLTLRSHELAESFPGMLYAARPAWRLINLSTLPSPTLAELLMPLPAANPFSTMRASLRWYSSEELEDGVTYGGQSWLRRGSVDSFFSSLLLRDGDAAGRRKRSSS